MTAVLNEAKDGLVIAREEKEDKPKKKNKPVSTDDKEEVM